jgi:AcrR family transcriptional regulator
MGIVKPELTERSMMSGEREGWNGLTSQGPDLAARLHAALLPNDRAEGEAPRSAADLILDAATRRFVDVGIKATTMSSIATEAEISREWLYRHFSNKGAVVTALVHRELRRFIDGLAATAEWNDDLVEMLTETFVYCVEFFRDRPVIDGLLRQGGTMRPEEFRARASEIVTLATHTCAGYLADLGGFDARQASFISETLVRLVGSTLMVPAAQIDLNDPIVLRDYAACVVPAVVRGC